jgi:hypothetical protein
MENCESLLAAERSKDVEALRQAVWGLNQSSAPTAILSRLLLEGWHDSHEDIVFEVGLIGNPQAVDAILNAATLRFEYLVQRGNLHEFQRKCAFALARIGTDESRTALVVLARSEDTYIREYGKEGLANWPLPFRRQ